MCPPLSNRVKFYFKIVIYSIGCLLFEFVKILTLYHFAAAKVPLRTVCVEHFCGSIKNKVNWHLKPRFISYYGVDKKKKYHYWLAFSYYFLSSLCCVLTPRDSSIQLPATHRTAPSPSSPHTPQSKLKFEIHGRPFSPLPPSLLPSTASLYSNSLFSNVWLTIQLKHCALW